MRHEERSGGKQTLVASWRPQSTDASFRISNTNKFRDILKCQSPEKKRSNRLFHSENELTKQSSSVQIGVTGWGSQAEINNLHFQHWSELSSSPDLQGNLLPQADLQGHRDRLAWVWTPIQNQSRRWLGMKQVLHFPDAGSH